MEYKEKVFTLECVIAESVILSHELSSVSELGNLCSLVLVYISVTHRDVSATVRRIASEKTEKHAAIFGILRCTYFILGRTKSFSGILNSMVV